MDSRPRLIGGGMTDKIGTTYSWPWDALGIYPDGRDRYASRLRRKANRLERNGSRRLRKARTLRIRADLIEGKT